MDNLTPFPCTSCGKCCRRVNLSEHTAYLDRGDGVCRHFNDDTNLCLIYDDRPLICQIENYYKKHLAEHIAWDNFVRLNLEICKKL